MIPYLVVFQSIQHRIQQHFGNITNIPKDADELRKFLNYCRSDGWTEQDSHVVFMWFGHKKMEN